MTFKPAAVTDDANGVEASQGLGPLGAEVLDDFLQEFGEVLEAQDLCVGIVSMIAAPP